MLTPSTQHPSKYSYQSLARRLVKSLTKAILYFCGLIIILGVAVLAGMWVIQPKFKAYQSPQYNPTTGEFFNTPASQPVKSGVGNAMLSMVFDSQKHRPKGELPTIKTDWQAFIQPQTQARFVWFGHSALMARMDNKTLLIDPSFANSASPVPVMMTRFAPKPDLASLPDVDYIIYSHAHYDHLDADVVKFYQDKDTKFIVPLGVGAYLTKWGIDENRITELDWWQHHTVDNLTLTAVPARHDSARTAFDTKKSLWAGWVFQTNNEQIYFSGDSSYALHFEQIGKKFGGFDLAFVENGQYNELWPDNHMFPHQTVQVVKDVKARQWMPIHWGAYPLSTHGWSEPVIDSSRLSDEQKLSLLSPKIGQIFDSNTPTERWWVGIE